MKKFIILSLLMAQKSYAKPEYCDSESVTINKRINQCIDITKDDSLKSQLIFAREFNEKVVTQTTTHLKSKIQQTALNGLVKAYNDLYKSFPTQKPVQVSAKTRSCLQKKGINLPRLSNGRLGPSQIEARENQVKKYYEGSLIANSLKNQITRLRSKIANNSPLKLRKGRRLTREQLRENENRRAINNSRLEEIKLLEDKLDNLAMDFPYLFNPKKNFLLYPSDTPSFSNLQDEINTTVQNNTPSTDYYLIKENLARDLSNPTHSNSAALRVTSIIDENKDKLYAKDNLTKLSYKLEAEHVKNLKNLSEGLDQICSGDIDKLHHNPFLMTGVMKSIPVTEELDVYKMAHCKMIEDDPIDDINWVLIAAAGGIAVTSFIPGVNAVVLGAAGAVGFASYGGYQTYLSHNIVQNERALTNSGHSNLERVRDAQRSRAMNAYLTTLDLVAPEIGHVLKSGARTVQIARHAKDTDSQVLAIWDDFVAPSNGEILVSEQNMRQNSVEYHWWKRFENVEPKVPFPGYENIEELKRVLGEDEYSKVMTGFIKSNDTAVKEMMARLDQFGIPYESVPVHDDILPNGQKRLTFKIYAEDLEKAGIPNQKLAEFFNKQYSKDGKQGLDKLFFEYDPMALQVMKAQAASEIGSGILLKSNDLERLVFRKGISGTMRHELQHKYFETLRDNGIDSPYGMMFMASNNGSLGEKSGYGNFMSAEELYNYANQGFWDMKDDVKAINRLSTSDIAMKLEDYNTLKKRSNRPDPIVMAKKNIKDFQAVAFQALDNSSSALMSIDEMNLVKDALHSKGRYNIDSSTMTIHLDKTYTTFMIRPFNDKNKALLEELDTLVSGHKTTFHAESIDLSKEDPVYNAAISTDMTRYHSDQSYKESIDRIVEVRQRINDVVKRDLESIAQRAEQSIEKSYDVQDSITLHELEFERARNQYRQEFMIDEDKARNYRDSYLEMYKSFRKLGLSVN